MLTIKKLVVAFCFLVIAFGTLRMFEKTFAAEKAAIEEAEAEKAIERLWQELKTTTNLYVLEAKVAMSQDQPVVLNDRFQAIIFINEVEPYKLDITVKVYRRYMSVANVNEGINPLYVRSGLIR